MEPDKKALAEVSGNLFFQSKNGFKSHVQIKTTIVEGEKIDIVTLLLELEQSVLDNGGKPETFSPKAKSMDDAATESFGAKSDKPKADGECPNGCGKRPWIEGGVSKKTGKAYNAFWGECRVCGFKGR